MRTPARLPKLVPMGFCIFSDQTKQGPQGWSVHYILLLRFYLECADQRYMQFAFGDGSLCTLIARRSMLASLKPALSLGSRAFTDWTFLFMRNVQLPLQWQLVTRWLLQNPNFSWADILHAKGDADFVQHLGHYQPFCKEFAFTFGVDTHCRSSCTPEPELLSSAYRKGSGCATCDGEVARF